MHIYGYDKLKLLGFAIHGAIDGYSKKYFGYILDQATITHEL